MSNEYPLYPDLPEGGAEQAQALVNCFKEDLKKAAEEVLSTLYTDVVPHIQSDSWLNFRNDLLDALKGYSNVKLKMPHDFKTIRRNMLRDFHDEIIADLNQDLVEEVAALKTRIEQMQRDRYPC